MKRLKLLGVAIAFSALFSYAQAASDGSALWMRYGAISPDGGTIAFAYKGDIFTVPAGGGEARQITSNAAFDSRPVWSPDGTKIAFASYRNDNADVYIVAKEGGEPFRVTTHFCNELPVAFMNDSTILYSANILPDPESMQYPSETFQQVYAIDIKGGRPKMFSSLPLESITFSPDGKTILYHDKKGVEDEWRKHHTSSVTRDIWSCEFEGGSVKHGKFTKISKFEGEDRNPVFSPDGKSFYYLSEQGGSFNVWKSDLKGKNPVQITKFTANPVRFLTIASDGTLCFGYDGEIYTCDDGGNAKKVDVKVFADRHDKELIKRRVSGASEIALSKDGKQVAFIYGGDVYVTATEYKTTKRITNTPEEERNLDFAPDGRSLIYSSERNGVWQIYRTSIVNENEKYFPYCTKVKEDRITNSDLTSFQPLFKPDGKEIAFLENRTTIRVINLETKKVRTVMDGKYQSSYRDGDQWYRWSPDGKWILSNSITEGGWGHMDVVLLDASGNGVMHNLTANTDNDIKAKWVLDGKAMTWLGGSRNNVVYIMFFDKDAYIKFNMSNKEEEELTFLEEAEQEKKEKEEVDQVKKSKDKKKSSKKDKKAKEEPKDSVVLDLENAEYRFRSLASASLFVMDAVLSKKGDKLYYLAISDHLDINLWVKDFKKSETKILVKEPGQGSLILSEDGKTLFIHSGNIKKIDLASGEVTPVEIDGVFEYKPYAEKEYIFDHAWRQILDRFYDPDIHGIDWAGYKKTYFKFLPHINNNFDFAEMLSEMLGELNASHTGARYYRWPEKEFETAFLGAFYDETYTGDGLKIKEIIKRGPLTLVKSDIKAGDIIEKIDGEPVLAGKDYFPLLDGKVEHKICLTVFNPETKKHFDIIVKGISSMSVNNLLYQRWVDRNKELVDKYSDGKIGYVHIAAMNSSSYSRLYKELLSRYRNREAVVVDTRHNGGGSNHDDVVTLLSGKEYLRCTPRGQYVGSDPLNKWKKPSCMMIGEDNYSDAHGLPWVYHTLGIGKLVGAPVPGTMTAVWWEGQIDQSIVVGIPEVGMMSLDGEYLENQQLEPDILIYNTPEDFLNGYDAQLEGAVKSLMK